MKKLNISSHNIHIVLNDETKEIKFITQEPIPHNLDNLLKEIKDKSKKGYLKLLEYDFKICSLEEEALKWAKLKYSHLKLNKEQFKVAAISLYKEQYGLS